MPARPDSAVAAFGVESKARLAMPGNAEAGIRAPLETPLAASRRHSI